MTEHLTHFIRSMFIGIVLTIRVLGPDALHSEPLNVAVVIPLLGQSDGFQSVAYSNDGAWIASGGGDGTVAIWELKTGRIIRRFSGDTKSAVTVTISPDKKFVASISRSIRIWEISSGKLVREFANLATNQMAMSPDWRWMAVDSSIFQGTKLLQVIKVADSVDGRVTKTLIGHTGDINKIAYSKDGRLIVSASDDKTVRLWEAQTGNLIRAFSGHQGAVTAVAISSDGQRVVSGSKDKSVKIWSAANGNAQRTIVGSDEIISVAISEDNQQVAVSSNGETKILDLNTGGLIWTSDESKAAYDLKFSPDGLEIAIATYDKIAIRDAKNGTLIKTLERRVEAGNPVAFGADGATLVADGRILRMWNTSSGRLSQVSKNETKLSSVLAISPDGKSAATASYDGIAVWDLSSGNLLRSFPKIPEYTSSLIFSPDGHFLISGGGKVFRVWDMVGSAPARTVNVPGQYSVTSMAISPDGRVLAVSSLDILKLYDFATGRIVRAFERRQGDGYDTVAFSKNGQWIATGGFATCPIGCTSSSRVQWGIIRLWDVASGRVIRSMDDYESRVQTIAISPDSQSIVGVGNDNTIKVWETNSGRFLRSLSGNATTVKSLAFSPNGRWIAAGSDSESKIWDASTGQILANFVGSEQGEWAAITPEGFFDASSKGAELLYVINGFETASMDQFYKVLYRPDLVREKLAGDPDGKVKAAAAKLDLEKVMASGLAPKLAITSPAAGTAAADEIAVEAAVSDQGGGIGKVEWRVNGVTSGIETRGLERVEAAASAGSTLTVKRTLALERGENRIEVLAYNAKDLIASEPASVTVTWDGERGATPPKLFVMAVGVNDYYDSRLRLSYAVPDATAIAEGFRKAGTGLYAAVDVTTVLDSDVTIANLDKVFTELGKKAQPRDVFVFFLAGHGKTKNGRYYFLPRDFRYEDEDSIEKAAMGQDKFQAWFAEIPARKSILLYDTCESGSLTGTNARGSDIDERLGALNRMTRATGRTFLTATTDDAPALEGYHGHGVFTYAILDALDHGDVNKNGLIEVSELADYIDQKVPDISFDAFKLRQIPQRSIVGNNFALTNKATVLTATNAPAVNLSKAIASVPAIATPSSNPAISAKPTHVVITTSPTDVFESIVAGDTKKIAIQRLSFGTLVVVMKSENGWDLITREGTTLGYVAHTSLAPVQ
jgi:WD40 repeat protein